MEKHNDAIYFKLISLLKNIPVKKTCYFILLPAFITILLTVIFPSSGMYELIAPYSFTNFFVGLMFLALFFIPSLLTSLITSFIAIQTKKTLREFFLYWLVPTFFSQLLDIIIKFIQEFPYSSQHLFDFLASYTFFSFWALIGILTTGIIGISIGRYSSMVKEGVLVRIPKQPFKYYPKVAAIACMLGLFLTFLLGNMINIEDLMNKDHFDYYIHRGIPYTFSGVLREGYAVTYPIVILPTFSITLDDGNTFYKIVHVEKFMQSLGFYILLSLFPHCN